MVTPFILQIDRFAAIGPSVWCGHWSGVGLDGHRRPMIARDRDAPKG
jgi:hypothetical protein